MNDTHRLSAVKTSILRLAIPAKALSDEWQIGSLLLDASTTHKSFRGLSVRLRSVVQRCVVVRVTSSSIILTKVRDVLNLPPSLSSSSQPPSSSSLPPSPTVDRIRQLEHARRKRLGRPVVGVMDVTCSIGEQEFTFHRRTALVAGGRKRPG